MAVRRARVLLEGNRNALKHGLYTQGAIAERRRVRDLIRQSRELLSKID